MLKSFSLTFVLASISAMPCTAQVTYNCFGTYIKPGSAENLDSLTNILVASQSDKDYYLIGESHTYLANNDFQYALIKALHPFGVYNIVSEQPHAVCFLFNEYLETGDNSLLQQIKPSATYDLLKKIRHFNAQLGVNERMKYYGIDYLDADFDYDNYVLALKLIRAKNKVNPLPLDHFIDEKVSKGSLNYADVQLLQTTLNHKLITDSLLYKQHYNNYYYDLLLMSSNMIERKKNRDDKIMQTFQLLYESLLDKKILKPRFLSFYGIGHLFNFGNLLQMNPTSPVKNNLFRVGIQYVNCLGGWNTASQRDDGLYSANKKSLGDLIGYCKQQSWTVGLMTDTKCISFFAGRRPDAIMIFNKYGNRKMNSWKFD
jgi:hypothetical protein